MTDYSPLELSLPERTGHETVEQRLAALEETVPRLLEALQYTLSNLGAENFNAAALSRLLSPIRARIDGADGSITQLSLDAGTLQTRLTSAEGNVAALEQTVSDQGTRIALVTDADGVNAAAIVAAINNGDSSIALSADKIDLNGITTVADTLHIGSQNSLERKYLIFHKSDLRDARRSAGADALGREDRPVRRTVSQRRAAQPVRRQGMYLPTFPRRMAAVRHVQTDFRGYDHRPSCPEGGIYEMTNGSAADSPLFSTRPGRTRIYPCSGTPNGLFAAGDGLLWCAGTALYYNGKAVPGCTLTDTPKVFAALGGTVLIWPDKVWFRPADGTFGSAEPSWSGSVTLAGADTDGDGRASILVADGAGTDFRTGDAVTLSGFGDVRNNGTYILRGIDGTRLRFDPDTFVRAGAVNGVTITRRVPDAQHACSYGNRLWACAHDSVWCTKLGDPLSWFWYEADENGAVATAAWSVDAGAPGDFSGCAATGSGVVFLKPGGLWRLYGTRPTNFQLVASAALGAEQDSGRSLVTAAETLYYLSPVGAARTAGGRPVRIGDALGRTLTHGVAGTDGTRWYLSARDERSVRHLFVYDTRSGLWSREDDFDARGFAQCGGALYAQDTRGVWRFGAGSTAQMESLLETGDFISGSPDCKRLLRVQLRLEAEAGASITAAAQYDSDGQWHTLANVTAGAKRTFTLPVLPRRCDHFRLRLTGTGAWRLCSLTRTETAAGPQH